MGGKGALGDGRAASGPGEAASCLALSADGCAGVPGGEGADAGAAGVAMATPDKEAVSVPIRGRFVSAATADVAAITLASSAGDWAVSGWELACSPSEASATGWPSPLGTASELGT